MLTPANPSLGRFPDSTTRAISTKSVSLQRAMTASWPLCSPWIPPKLITTTWVTILWIELPTWAWKKLKLCSSWEATEIIITESLAYQAAVLPLMSVVSPLWALLEYKKQYRQSQDQTWRTWGEGKEKVARDREMDRKRERKREREGESEGWRQRQTGKGGRDKEKG